MPSTELTTEQINLEIAKIAGWTNIHAINPNIEKITWQGTNEAHPELGTFIPKYTEDLNAIALVYKHLQRCWSISVTWDGQTNASSFNGDSVVGSTTAIALCKLLLAID